jgi:hypothetical protein
MALKSADRHIPPLKVVGFACVSVKQFSIFQCSRIYAAFVNKGAAHKRQKHLDRGFLLSLSKILWTDK